MPNALFGTATTTAYQEEVPGWLGVLEIPEDGAEVPASGPMDVVATLERTEPTPGPTPGEETAEMLLNGQVVARESHLDLVQGDSVTLEAPGLAPDNSPLAFGDNIVSIGSTQFGGFVTAGEFVLVDKAAVVTSLTFNKATVREGELFRASVVYRGNRDWTFTRDLVINKVRRNPSTGEPIDETTLLNTDVTVRPGTNEEEFAIKMESMLNEEELCAFIPERDDPPGGGPA